VHASGGVRLGALNAEKRWGSGASYGATEVMHPSLSGMIRDQNCDQIQDSKSLTARMTGIIRTRRILKEASTHMATIEQSETRRARSAPCPPWCNLHRGGRSRWHENGPV
jgi:hypothetical protein